MPTLCCKQRRLERLVGRRTGQPVSAAKRFRVAPGAALAKGALSGGDVVRPEAAM